MLHIYGMLYLQNAAGSEAASARMQELQMALAGSNPSSIPALIPGLGKDQLCSTIIHIYIQLTHAVQRIYVKVRNIYIKYIHRNLYVVQEPRRQLPAAVLSWLAMLCAALQTSR